LGETIKSDYCYKSNDCRPKFVSTGLSCGIGCMLALSVMHSITKDAARGLWCYVSSPVPLPFSVSSTAQWKCPTTSDFSKQTIQQEQTRNESKIQSKQDPTIIHAPSSLSPQFCHQLKTFLFCGACESASLSYSGNNTSACYKASNGTEQNCNSKTQGPFSRYCSSPLRLASSCCSDS